MKASARTRQRLCPGPIVVLMLLLVPLGLRADESHMAGSASRAPANLGVVSVTAFGAKGDGLADDRPAIQAALDAGYAHGLGVQFPAGTFLLRTASQPEDRILRTYPGQRLMGHGSLHTTLLVAPDFGRYVTVLGAGSDQTDIGRWSLSGLAIDQNALAGNLVDLATLHTYPRMAIRIGSYRAESRIEISRCGLRAASSLNGFYVFAQDVVVSLCRFDGIGGPVGSPVHDHSTIYSASVVADGSQVITDNVFDGVRGSGGARSAIDTHGGRQSVRNNVIRDYLRGMNVTGMGRIASPSVTIERNSILDAEIGVEFWVRRRARPSPGPELQQVVLRDNVIDLRGSAWRLPGLQANTRAVVTNARNDQTLGRMVIENNVFSNLDQMDPERRQVGIDCTNQHTTHGIEDVAIVRNVFRGEWSAIIDPSCFGVRASISGNAMRS